MRLSTDDGVLYFPFFVGDLDERRDGARGSRRDSSSMHGARHSRSHRLHALHVVLAVSHVRLLKFTILETSVFIKSPKLSISRCCGASLWARLSHVYYAADHKDALAVGFDDAPFWEKMRDGKSITDMKG